MINIICAFPGTGRKDAINKSKEFGDGFMAEAKLKDFMWMKDSSSDSVMRHPDFPANYTEHIKELAADNLLVLATIQKDFLKELEDRKIRYCVVLPRPEHKYDYFKKYKEEGQTDEFLEDMEENFENIIREISDHWKVNQEKFTTIRLSEDESLSDLIDDGLVELLYSM